MRLEAVELLAHLALLDRKAIPTFGEIETGDLLGSKVRREPPVLVVAIQVRLVFRGLLVLVVSPVLSVRQVQVVQGLLVSRVLLVLQVLTDPSDRTAFLGRLVR